MTSTTRRSTPIPGRRSASKISSLAIAIALTACRTDVGRKAQVHLRQTDPKAVCVETSGGSEVHCISRGVAMLCVIGAGDEVACGALTEATAEAR